MESSDIESSPKSNAVPRLGTTGGSEPRYFDLQTTVTIGRSSDCDIRVNDLAASRVHCRLVPDKSRVWLYDSGSRWGTFVNGRRIWFCELHPGDEITIGNSMFKFVRTVYFGLQQTASVESSSPESKC